MLQENGVLAKRLAERLNISYIDTGAMYRAAGLYFYQNNIELNEENVKKYIDNINIDIYYINNDMKTLLNGEDVSIKIRENEISKMASAIGVYSIVRSKLVDLQRKMSYSKSVIMDGRDIGTVVFPNADVKIFLTASTEQRAIRRQKDIVKKEGKLIDLKTLEEELDQRDCNDMSRSCSPLKMADDAVLLDTTSISIEEMIDEAYKIVKERIDL
ncbi:MAG: (d)CMP kinase [Clostridia bacterium]|nr:(d)CMP kinase [Clostridia bacterium]